ncbi:phosphohydrolase [Bacillus sp. J14TS2]|uniref:HD domain-containing protein n=1 Tax=Bacillus sp. J14TS2 TaxID=2807188 RepID=UPI001B179E6F|nr:HD domain-containing protein [Bacillus sp. J14TS2]GIN73025.1 phosphohydrolase [Bacillus sp. J14TS2]
MDKAVILDKTREWVYQKLKADASGHDWWHIVRVTQTAKIIAEEEKADIFICELAALLHDIADIKLYENEAEQIEKIKKWLKDLTVEDHTIASVIEIIQTMSYRGGGRPPMKTKEGEIVQDADRLDAIGAIGIARTFAFSGAMDRLIYDPIEECEPPHSSQHLQIEHASTIQHFYDKLLHLKDLMNTEYARRMAETRHSYMEGYLKQFFKEWSGEL